MLELIAVGGRRRVDNEVDGLVEKRLEIIRKRRTDLIKVEAGNAFLVDDLTASDRGRLGVRCRGKRSFSSKLEVEIDVLAEFNRAGNGEVELRLVGSRRLGSELEVLFEGLGLGELGNHRVEQETGGFRQRAVGDELIGGEADG